MLNNSLLTALSAVLMAAGSALGLGIPYDGSGDPTTVFTESVNVTGNSYNEDALFTTPGTVPGFLTANGSGNALLIRDFDLNDDGVADNGTPVLIKADGWNVEWRSRAINENHPGSLTTMIGGGDDSNNWSVRFDTDGTIGGGSVDMTSSGTVPNPAISATHTGIDLTAFHTFKVNRAPGADEITFSIDGTQVLSLDPRPLGLPGSDFGNVNTVFVAPSAVEWAYDFINLNVPEPATLGLLGVGGLAALGRRRRR